MPPLPEILPVLEFGVMLAVKELAGPVIVNTAGDCNIPSPSRALESCIQLCILEDVRVSERSDIGSEWWIGDDGSLVELVEVASAVGRQGQSLSLRSTGLRDGPVNRQELNCRVDECSRAIDSIGNDRAIEYSDGVVLATINNRWVPIGMQVAIGRKIPRRHSSNPETIVQKSNVKQARLGVGVVHAWVANLAIGGQHMGFWSTCVK